MKRKLSLLMVLMMVLTLIPAMPSFAATKAEIPNPATIEFGGTTGQPILLVEAVTDITTTSSITVTLNNGEFTTMPAVAAPVTGYTNPVANRMVVGVAAGVTAGTKIQIPLNVKSTNNSDITADVWGSGDISSATGLLVAKVAEGNVGVSFRSVTNIKRGDNTTQLADLEIRELNNNAFKTNSEIEVKLDNRGYEFIGTYSVALNNVITNMTGVTVTVKDSRTLVVKTTAPTGGNDYVVIKPEVRVTRDARLGEDVFVRALGVNATVTPTDRILAAKYTDFGVNFKVEKVLDVKAGRHIPGEYVAVITMEEAVVGSLSGGRIVEVKLPGASLQNGETVYVKRIAGDAEVQLMDQKWFEEFATPAATTRTSTVAGSMTGTQTAKVDAKYADDTYKLVADYIELQTQVMSGSSSNVPGKWEIRLPFVVKTGMTGDLNAEITVAREKMDPIKVATVQAPVTIEVKKGENGKLADLIIGKQHQSAPEILIKENYAGALLERDAVDSIIYTIEEAQGYKIVWNDFDYEVVEGDLEIYDRLTEVNDDDKGINIAIDRRSSKPSTIKISNIDITLDRTVPYGEHPVEFYMGNVAYAHRISNFLTDAPFFNVVTPYPEDKQLKTVFTIGEAEYVQAVDGRDVKTPMDVAPQIMNNRTVLPIRYVADALGAKVNYDPATRTAIFSKDAMVVSMTLDTNVMYVNGSPVVMDVAPMVQNDRALVPVVYVAQAFGLTSVAAPAVGDIVWDAAVKTVTLFPNAQ